MLGQFARIQGVMLATDKNSSGQEYCLGYGFAVCQSKEDVDALLAQSNKLTYKGRYITLREYKVGSKLKEDKNKFNKRRLFIGNVPQTTSSTEIMEHFAEFGSIENVYFVDQDKLMSYKYGYIVFHDEKAAERAISGSQGIQIGTFKLRIEYFGGKRSSCSIYGSHSKSKNSSKNISPCDRKHFSSLESHSELESLNINSPITNPILTSQLSIDQIRISPVKDAAFEKQQPEECSVLVEDTSAWKKVLFRQHKTCSLEYHLQIPSLSNNTIEQTNSPLDPKSTSHRLSTSICGQANFNMVKSITEIKGDCDQASPSLGEAIGLPLMSSEQTEQVAANHGISNIRLNPPRRLTTRVYRR